MAFSSEPIDKQWEDYKVEGVTVFIAVNENGDEGIIGFKAPHTGEWMPMVISSTKVETIEMYWSIARRMVRGHNQTIKELRFTRRSVVREEHVD